MSELNFDLEPTDRKHATEIAQRAAKLLPGLDVLSTVMDLSAVHNHAFKLNFELMAKADNHNLVHDIAGIKRHLNRETGKLGDCFIPRYAI